MSDNINTADTNINAEADKINTKDNEEAVVRCGTTQGDFAMHLRRHWSPHGYDRAIELFDSVFMDGSHFFRVVPHFLVQFGLTYSADETLRKLQRGTIPDDQQLQPQRIPFEPGTVSFAGGGKDSRSSQLFISYGSAASLGTQLWETPIGKVVEGMEHIENLYAGYGDMPPWGHGPEQPKIRSQGLSYMQEQFPEMDRFTTCTVEIITGQQPKEKLKQEQATIVMETPRSNIRRQQAVNSNLEEIATPGPPNLKPAMGIMPDIGKRTSGSGSGDEESLPMAAVTAGIILCGAVLCFFIRIVLRQANTPSKKVS
jgi:cyclophilin family peptidyl-prolyl cis-trans isomerase